VGWGRERMDAPADVATKRPALVETNACQPMRRRVSRVNSTLQWLRVEPVTLQSWPTHSRWPLRRPINNLVGDISLSCPPSCVVVLADPGAET